MDITEFGANSLVCGDVFRFLRWVPDGSFTDIVTDPPFGQGQTISYGRSELGHRKIHGDDGLQWLPKFAAESYRVTGPDAWCVLYWQWRTYSILEAEMLAAGWELKTVGIWDKKQAGLGSGLAEGYEQICFFRKDQAREAVKLRSNVYRYARPKAKKGKRIEHPHEKPVALQRDVIQTVCEPGRHIFDPFAGSYSVGRACAYEDVIYTGVEIDAEHAANGLKRFAVVHERETKQLSLRREAAKVHQTELIF